MPQQKKSGLTEKSSRVIQDQKPEHLKRELSLFGAVMYGLGVIIGAGIYVLVGKGAGLAGNGVWLSFAIAAIIAALTGLSYAELSSMYPRSGAEYVYTRKAFSNKLFSFSFAWFIVFVGAVAAATVALGFGGYFESMFGTPAMLNAAALILFLSILNFYGLKQSMKFNITCVIITVGGLLLIILLGIPYLGSVNYLDFRFGFAGIMSAAALIFFAYLGFEDIANISEETKKPRSTIPKAIFLSVLITTVLYVLVSISAISILPWQELARSSAPLADVAGTVIPNSSFLFSIVALVATASTVLIFLIAYSRMLFGMAEEHSLPRIFQAIHHSRKTPWFSIFLLMTISILFVMVGDIQVVAGITDFGAFLIFSFVNLSLIWLRYKEPSVERDFRVPINIGVFPVLPFLGLLFSALMLFQFDWSVALLSAGIIISGALVYKFFAKANSVLYNTNFMKKAVEIKNEMLSLRKNGMKKKN